MNALVEALALGVLIGFWLYVGFRFAVVVVTLVSRAWRTARNTVFEG